MISNYVSLRCLLFYKKRIKKGVRRTSFSLELYKVFSKDLSCLNYVYYNYWGCTLVFWCSTYLLSKSDIIFIYHFLRWYNFNFTSFIIIQCMLLVYFQSTTNVCFFFFLYKKIVNHIFVIDYFIFIL